MQILMHVAEQQEEPSAREIAEALAMPVATVHHLLQTLVDQGMLAKGAPPTYTLGPRIGALADAFHRRIAPPEFLMAPLRQLTEETGETVYLSGWQGETTVVLATLEGRQAVRVSSLHSGYVGHDHARAAGKVLLAFARPGVLERYLTLADLERRTPHTITDRAVLAEALDEVRSQGYALDSEEFAPGVSCVSVPVLEGSLAIAAYTVAAPTERFMAHKEALIAATRRMAQLATATQSDRQLRHS